MPMHAAVLKYGSPYFVVWAQLLLAAVLSAAWAAFPGAGEHLFRSLEFFFARFAARKTVAVIAAFLAPIIVRSALLPLMHVPRPGGQDESCYLLAAEMFSKGRLAFPQPAMWKSLETFHVNFRPVYAPMYPPAQGAVLALGILLGNAWIGVLLSVAGMCAAIVWMLQAWMPARWALLGGVITICNLGVVSYWINSYWGGAVAAAGGALVLGALPRIVSHWKIRDGLLLGLGVAILANSRPYEGFIFCVPAGAWFLWRLRSAVSSPEIGGKEVSGKALRVFGATATVLCATALFMGYYNWRLTGNPLLMPHALNIRTYYRTPLFLWEQAIPLIHYNNPQYENFYNGWLRTNYVRNWGSAVHASAQKMRDLISAYLWPGALTALPCVLLAVGDRRVRFLFVELCVTLAAVFAVVYSEPHYAAPLTCVFYGLLVQGFRHMRTLRLGAKPVGIGLARACVALLLLNTGYNVYHVARSPREAYPGWWNEGNTGGLTAVEALDRQLAKFPGNHLIVVRYAATHNPHGEWVFNHADVDNSRVVWARELDAEQNRKLLEYYKGRKVWLFEPDRDIRKLTPLDPDAASPGMLAPAASSNN